MTDHLEIADSLALPIDYVTKTAAVLAQRRKGKTYTASVIAEELVRLDQPWVALDPTGAWWGMRAGADGSDQGGLPVVILGGQHGDAPLEPGSGKFVAELVVDTPGWYVLDMSLLDTRAAERAFATDFGEALIRRKRQPGRDFPMHLFVDEADMFAPQEKDGGGDARMLGAYQAIVRRGGLHGLGSTLISQRPALLNKSVLTQLDILVLLRLVAGQDQDAVDKSYLSRAGSKEDRAAVMGSLASLRLGEAWVWEPGAEPPIFDRVQIRERRTYNSSATPKPGENRAEPRGLADVDLDAVKAAMEAAIERAKADDPAELRRRIKALERDLADAQDRPDTVAEPEIVEQRVEVIPPEAIDTAHKLREYLDFGLQHAAALAEVLESYEQPAGVTIHRQVGTVHIPPPPPVPRDPARARVERAPRPAPATPSAGSSDIPKGERAVLVGLAQHGDRGCTREMLTVLTGYKRSTRNTYLQRLGTAGLVEERGGRFYATADGLAALGDYNPLPTGADLLAYHLANLPAGEAATLEAIAAAHPHGILRDDLQEITGYKRSTSNTYVQRLATRELVDPQGSVIVAAELLFDA